MSFSPLQTDEIEILVSFAIDEGLVEESAATAIVALFQKTQAQSALSYYGEQCREMFPEMYITRPFDRWLAEDPSVLIGFVSKYAYHNEGMPHWESSPMAPLFHCLAERVRTKLWEQMPGMNLEAAEHYALARLDWAPHRGRLLS